MKLKELILEFTGVMPPGESQFNPPGDWMLAYPTQVYQSHLGSLLYNTTNFEKEGKLMTVDSPRSWMHQIMLVAKSGKKLKLDDYHPTDQQLKQIENFVILGLLKKRHGLISITNTGKEYINSFQYDPMITQRRSTVFIPGRDIRIPPRF